MATSKYFECDHCGSEGKITVKSDDVSFEDLVYCPVCGGDIYEEEDYEDE